MFIAGGWTREAVLVARRCNEKLQAPVRTMGQNICILTTQPEQGTGIKAQPQVIKADVERIRQKVAIMERYQKLNFGHPGHPTFEDIVKKVNLVSN